MRGGNLSLAGWGGTKLTEEVDKIGPESPGCGRIIRKRLGGKTIHPSTRPSNQLETLTAILSGGLRSSKVHAGGTLKEQ